MTHGLNSVMKQRPVQCKSDGKTGVGSRRIFSPQFKLQVLDSYRSDADCKGNQRATARKYGIHRRQIQKWLQVEATLRTGVVPGKQTTHASGAQALKNVAEMALNGHRQRDDDIIRGGRCGGSASLATATNDARVPSLDCRNEPNPYGIKTESRTGWVENHHETTAPLCLVPDPATPIDLSFKRPPPSPPCPLFHRPSLPSPSLPMATTTTTTGAEQPDVWDLSTTKRPDLKRRSDDEHEKNLKPIKLFKPYLDVVADKEMDSDRLSSSSSHSTNYCCQTSSDHLYYVNNNNNNVCCLSPEYTIHSPYTIQELQPKSFYPYPYYPEYQLSPTSFHRYEEMNSTYNLEFQVSAMNCCYQDSLCKGNPRAVVMKYHSETVTQSVS